MTQKQSRPDGGSPGRLTTTTTTALTIQAAAGCPLARAACRIEDPAVDAAVLQLHKPGNCPAVNRQRAA